MQERFPRAPAGGGASSAFLRSEHPPCIGEPTSRLAVCYAGFKSARASTALSICFQCGLRNGGSFRLSSA